MREQAEFYKLSLHENTEVHKTVLKNSTHVFEERSTEHSTWLDVVGKSGNMAE